MNEISPLDAFLLVARRWWIVTLAILIGGLGGWFFHLSQAPIYDASAAFTVAIDFTQTGPLLEWEQDQAINALREVLRSPDILAQVRREAEQRGHSPAASYIQERRQSVIELHVRHTDASQSAEQANHWANLAYATAVEAYSHALQASSLRHYLASLNDCLQAQPADPQTLCSELSLEELDRRRQQVEADLQSELLASKSLPPILVFDLAAPAEVPSDPVAYRLSWLILAGTLIGLVAGIFVAIWLPEHPKRVTPPVTASEATAGDANS